MESKGKGSYRLARGGGWQAMAEWLAALGKGGWLGSVRGYPRGRGAISDGQLVATPPVD